MLATVRVSELGAAGSCWCRARGCSSQQRHSLFPLGIFCILTPRPVCILHEIMRGAYRVNAWACFVPVREKALKVSCMWEREREWKMSSFGSARNTSEKLHFIALGMLIAFMKFHHECCTQLSASLLLAWKSIAWCCKTFSWDFNFTQQAPHPTS